MNHESYVYQRATQSVKNLGEKLEGRSLKSSSDLPGLIGDLRTC